MLNINIGPDDILKWFLALSAGEQIVTGLLAPVLVGGAMGWLSRRAWDHDQVSFWRDQVGEYKGKLKGASPSDAAAKIANLESELQSIKRQQQRTITPDQWKAIYDFLRVLPAEERGGVQIGVRHDNQEAQRYGIEFSRLFGDVGLGGGIGTMDAPADAVGLIIRIDSNRPRPPIADHLSKAFNLAGLKYQVQSLEIPRFALLCACELVIGKATTE